MFVLVLVVCLRCSVLLCTVWCGVMVSVVLLVCGCVLDCHSGVAGGASNVWLKQ